MKFKEMNKKAVALLIADKVKKIMDSKNFGEQYEVGEYVVEIVTVKGANIMRCGCKNGIIRNNQNPICSHKIAVIMFEQKNLFK